MLTTRYARTTVLMGGDGIRVTIDEDVEARTPDGRLVMLAGMVIVEKKAPGPPSAADRVLWSLRCRPVKVSKFGTGLAAIRRELPSNRWTRALRAPWIYGTAGASDSAVPGRDWPTAISA